MMGDMPATKLHVVTTPAPARQAARRSRTYWRLLACALNAAIWVIACVFLDAGWLAGLFAGIIGFLAAAMIVGASQDLHH